MSFTKQFAVDVSQRMDSPAMRADGDIVSIIELLIPVFIPLIENCFQEQPESFGAGCRQLAAEAERRSWKQMAFRIGVLRQIGLSEYRALPGGGRAFCRALIEQAAQTSPEQLDAVYAECCCC